MAFEGMFDSIVNPPYPDDTTFCSDMAARQNLLREVFGTRYDELVALNEGALAPGGPAPGLEVVAAFDERIKVWLTAIPTLIRVVVELHSGLWTGSVVPTDRDVIGEELGLSSVGVQALYEEGLRRLARPEAATRLDPRLSGTNGSQ